jgi:hypothetical protein
MAKYTLNMLLEVVEKHGKKDVNETCDFHSLLVFFPLPHV